MHKKIIIASIFIIFLAQDAIARSIGYDQYTVQEIFAGKPATPNFSTHKEARRYRALLRNQSKTGPNFAGHYTIVTISCGTSCAIIAVVDAQTGDVHFPQNLHHVFWAGLWHKQYGPQFKLNSRLLIVYGQVNGEDEPYGISYYEWKL